MKLMSTLTNEMHSHSSLNPINIKMDNRLSVRLYKDARPNYLEIAPLHKGLVLVVDGKELIEEGVGFGVPVVKYRDKTFFSSSAETSTQENEKIPVLKKRYTLDTVSRKRFWKAAYINDDFYSLIQNLFEKAYLRYESLWPIFNRVMELRRTFKIRTEFVRVKPRGSIEFKYLLKPSLIKIKVDFSDLELDKCQEILILNEQGSSYFRKYADTDGLELANEMIGAWTAVKANEASLSDAKKTLSFALENADTARLLRGWENTRGRFSWAGLSYSLSPKSRTFDYVIKIKTQRQN